ncbi:branched-subunit amino acid transport protein AzlD [Delftia sp. 60]|nr:branched-subunit amino acid transport protein AzlD [Delftia sp. 60]
MDLSWLWPWLACVGLAAITLFTRAFFLIPEREVPLPQWLKRGLKYAPLAALAAVIAPEIVMTNGRLISTVVDARLPALACAVMYFFTSAASWARSRLAWRSICHCISAWAGRRSVAESARLPG